MNLYKNLLWILCLLWACGDVIYEEGNGQITSEKRMLDSFDEIRLSGNYEVGIKQGAQEQLVIVTDENLMKYIQSSVEDGILIIEDDQKIRSKDGIKLYITYQELTRLRSAGASVIKTDGPLRSELFHLEVPGAGMVDLDVDVDELEVELAGAGLVKLKGRADQQTVDLRGVGSLKAFELESKHCQVTVSGVGGAEVNVKENLKAVVKGIGGIQYLGDPAVISDQVSGIGTIKKGEVQNDSDDDQAM